MKTPICDFVNEYNRKGTLRLHMPGHKGESILGCEGYDITEIDGADVLYSSSGIIRESEENAASLFGTERTLYSTEGSSLSIRAMLYLALLYAKRQGRAATVLAARNAHKSFVCACAMLDISPVWMYPEKSEGLTSCRLDRDSVERCLQMCHETPCAVYITSPDYLGDIADIGGIGEVCRKYGVLLLVDNAHGAYLKFMPCDIHPITLGADMCCDSAHKTLPVLTGGGYLHISSSAPSYLCDAAESAMAMFASTSPSYLILQSLDAANKYIADGYRERLADFCKKADELKQMLCAVGYTLIGDEAQKITICAKSYGYTGDEIAQHLRMGGIECEFADRDYTVLMLTPSSEGAVFRIYDMLSALPKRAEITEPMPSLPRGCSSVSIREAMLSPSREVPVRDAVGHILATPSVSCPPAVCVLVCGEVIYEDAVRAFEYYGIDRCRVVDR